VLSPSWEAANCAAIQKIPSNFKEPEGSSPCSQEPSTGPYPEPVRFRTFKTYLLKELSPSWEAANCAAIQKIPSNFKEHGGSSPCSQEPSTGPYPGMLNFIHRKMYIDYGVNFMQPYDIYELFAIIKKIIMTESHPQGNYFITVFTINIRRNKNLLG
jgi:hypothetical protein